MKQIVLASMFAIAVQAAEPSAKAPVLAELFTSEGCSSCPPADALLMKLDQAQPVAGAQIIVLSEHVDYWNYLGWKDPYSSAQFTQRQGTYARALAAESYTPQLVIDGRTAMVGSDGKAILMAVTREAARAKTPVRIVSAMREGNEAVVSLTVGAALSKGDVWVAIADERDISSVGRGENSGKTLNHVAVVRSLGKVGAVTKGAGLDRTVRVPLSGQKADLRVVVFVAESGGAVDGAAVERIGEVQ
jgi:hypothetical protein